MLRSSFKDYLDETTLPGSKKGASYFKALEMLGEILSISKGPFSDINCIWSECSVEKIERLRTYIIEQQKVGDIFQTNHAPSYWRKGFYSAALKTYHRFLIEKSYEDKLLSLYEDDLFVPSESEIEIDNKEVFEEAANEFSGQDVVREVKTRVGQSVFRKRVFEAYNSTCCITGLNVPELNRASHIIPWSESVETRLDPRNGLCLSATYDAAFDRHLISIDQDSRILLSKTIQQFFSETVVKNYFLPFQGQEIRKPNRFEPLFEYLEFHRRRLR